MKSTKRALHAFTGTATIFSTLAVLAIGASIIANSWAPMIDRTLGTVSQEIVNEEGDADDLYLFNNEEIDTTDKLVQWHKDLAEREAEEGSVLLKNENNVLPLTGSSPKVTLLGHRSHYPQYGGQIGSSPNAAQNVSLEQALTQKGFQINPVTVAAYEAAGQYNSGNYTGSFGQPANDYQPGTLANSFGVSVEGTGSLRIGEPSIDTLKGFAEGDIDQSCEEYNDAAIVVVGRPSSEAGEFYPGEEGIKCPEEFEDGDNILMLSINEKAVIDYATEHFDKVIVLVNSDSAMGIDYLKKNDKVDSVLWVGAPGNYGFLGVADILKGEVNPSGHLPDTYAVDASLSPAAQNYGVITWSNLDDISTTDMTYSDYRALAYLDEKEGIYTGYRYYETRYEDQILNQGNATSTKGSITGGAWDYDNEVSYSFGYGLSYTTFEQTLGDVTWNNNDKTVTATVHVKNTGDVAGKSVVQLYMQSPYTDYDKDNNVEKSAVQLVDFAKTTVLQPGAEADVTMTFDQKYLASYDYTNAKTYILDEGDYLFTVGNGAHEAINNILAHKGYDEVGGDESNVKVHHIDSLDTETFSTSDNGTEITNQFDDMSLDNLLSDYDDPQLSRQNWDSTWPTTTSNLTATSEMIEELRNDTYEVKTDDDVSGITWGENTGINLASMKNASYNDERWEYVLDSMTLEEAIQVFVTGNSQVAGISSINMPKLNVQDGPLGFSYSPLGAFANKTDSSKPFYIPETDPNANYNIYDSVTEPIIAASFNKDLAYEQGRLFGTDGLWGNSTILWGPGLNTHRTPFNGRNHEYYSEDPMLTAYMGSQVVRGGKEYGVIIAPKHFCFNDQESNRCGISPFMNEQRARENELRAFQMAFEDYGCLGTMTAFNRVGLTYASADEGLITNVLKGEWGFHGYIVTDMINGDKYMRADTSLLAGTTILDTSNSEWFTVDFVSGDATLQNALKEAMHMNLYAIVNSCGLNGMNASSHIVYHTTWWQATLIALYSVFIALAVISIGLVVFLLVKNARQDDQKEAN